MKEKIGPRNCLYPLPTTLVGANVAGRANYITIAHVGIMTPGSVSLGMNKGHYSNAGIIENGTFSVNIPSSSMVKITDYCGLVSGKKVDKGRLFDTFYGVLETAPMVRECPVNMECRLVETVDMDSHDIFIGEIVETWCDSEVVTEEKIDFARIDPLLFVMNDRSYWRLGDRFARAWSAGRDFQP